MPSNKGLIFFCDYFIIGGVEQVLVTACNALADAGYDVLIVWTGSVQDNFILRQISPKVKQFYASSALKLEYLPKPKKPFWKRKFWKLKRKINDYKLRGIGKHIENFEHYKYLIDFKSGYSQVAKIKSVPGQKKIVWLHGSSTLFFEANIFAANNLFAYDKLVCLTKEFRQFFIKKYPQYESKIVHIYNPFDIQEIRNKSLEDLPEIRQYLPYFLHVSRLDNDKDITTVIKACKLFYADGKRRTKTIFLGDGMKLQTYKDKVKNEGLEKDVFFLGSSDNPYPWMKQAEALILSSRSEGLPTVLIEGQICGALSVSSNCPNGPKEIFEDGKSGILFEVGDAAGLNRIMADIDDGKINRRYFTDNAEQSVARFDKKTFVTLFENMIIHSLKDGNND